MWKLAWRSLPRYASLVAQVALRQVTEREQRARHQTVEEWEPQTAVWLAEGPGLEVLLVCVESDQFQVIPQAHLLRPEYLAFEFRYPVAESARVHLGLEPERPALKAAPESRSRCLGFQQDAVAVPRLNLAVRLFPADTCPAVVAAHSAWREDLEYKAGRKGPRVGQGGELCSGSFQAYRPQVVLLQVLEQVDVAAWDSAESLLAPFCPGRHAQRNSVSSRHLGAVEHSWAAPRLAERPRAELHQSAVAVKVLPLA